MKYHTRNGLHVDKVVVLDRGDYTSCTVNIFGATVTSWRIRNQEMLFVSREAHFSGLTPIRGGIQFAFPVIGNWEFGPRHGFARDLPWTLDEGPEKLESGDIYAMFSLRDNAYTHSLWNYKFKLHYKIVLYEKKLRFSIGVENSSTYFPFEFKIVQHSFMRVQDVTNCEIVGFKNCRYKDLTKHNEFFVEDREVVTVSERTDRVYYNAPNEVVVKNSINGGTMKIIKKRTRDVNLWNPWLEQSMTISDLGDDEFYSFVSVEAGMIERPIRIEPLSCWEAFQTYEYVEQKKEPITTDFYDLFNGYC